MEDLEAEMVSLAKRATTIKVPSDVDSLREAIALARDGEEQAGGGMGRVAVEEGEYEWRDEIMVGGVEDHTDQQIAITGEFGDRTGGDGAIVGGALLRGQWVLCQNSWGSLTSLTLAFAPNVSPVGPRSTPHCSPTHSLNGRFAYTFS